MSTKSKKPNLVLTLDVWLGHAYGLTSNKKIPFVKCGGCTAVSWLDEAAGNGWLRLGCIIARWYCPKCHKRKFLHVDQCGLVWIQETKK